MPTLRDVFDSLSGLVEVEEGSRYRDGILGVVEGVFFVPDLPSRNGRKYPRKLWERVVNSPEVKKLLQNRLMFGTVGHDDLDLDALIRERKVSHLVTDLRIGEDGKGYGRAEILDTPVGRVLYTLLKNGSKLAISSKGWGEYKGVEDGVYVVDENSYILERFDFVVDPGFLQAIPGLKEEYEKVIQGGITDMNNDVVKMLIKEKSELQEKLLDMTKRVSELETQVKEKYNELMKVLQEWFGVSEEKDVKEAIVKISKLVERIAEKLVKKKGLDEDMFKGKDIVEVLDKLLKYLYVRCCIHEKMKDTQDDKEVLERFKYQSIKAQNEKDEKIEGIRISEKLLEYYKRRLVGIRKEVDRLKKLLIEARRKLIIVESLGGIDRLIAILNKTEKVLKSSINEGLKKEAQKLSAKYGKSESEVRKLIEQFGVKETEKLLKSDHKSVEDTNKIVVVKDENVKYWEKDLGSRLVEKFK